MSQTLSAFARKVVESMPMLADFGFVPARAYSLPDFVSYAKYLSDSVFAYVFVVDDRRGQSPLDVALWAAPIEAPDDSLTVLNIGYRISIAATRTPDSKFFAACEEKILTIAPVLDALVPAVETALETPPFPNSRTTVYLNGVALFRRALFRHDALRHWNSMVASSHKAALGRWSLKTHEANCEALAEELRRSGDLDDLFGSLPAGYAAYLNRLIAEQTYVRALVSAQAPHLLPTSNTQSSGASAALR